MKKKNRDTDATGGDAADKEKGNIMNATENKTPRTNKRTTTLTIGLGTLLLGMVIGGAAAETGTGLMILKNPKLETQTYHPAFPFSGSLAAGGSSEWNPLQQIRNLQQEMDQSFDQMFGQFQTNSQFTVFQQSPGYSLSLDVQDMKKQYQVRAYLPDAKASNVHVSLKNGRTLNVQVNRKQTGTATRNNTTTSIAKWGQYQQEIQLPTPGKAGQMKIKHQGNELIITIPKAA